MSDATAPDRDDNRIQIGDRLGSALADELQHLEINFFKFFDFSPDMGMHFGSFIAKKNFTRETGTSVIHNSIGFLFYNIFEDYAPTGANKNPVKQHRDKPYVRIFPFAISQRIHFTKNNLTTHVVISISADYLKSFLEEEKEHFQFLFDGTNNFLIEELMTDDILRTVNDIVKKDEPGTLKSYYYKLKAIELLFYLFESLRKRETAVHRHLSEAEIKSIYQVRDSIISSLHRSSPIAELTQLAGMNELKLRKIFTQVFGMGIYDYYQHFRIKEAARLLREEKLSVSEAGYRLGFENLSHFSRVFEKLIGKKPKKYSCELE